jgi:type VI secretion system secreted protein Hcp
MRSQKTVVKAFVVSTFIALASLAAVPSQAALNFYISIKGQKQGQIKGDVTQKGRENTIMGISYSHDILSPRDPASGLPSGRRQHKPITVRMEWGSQTPLLFSAMVNNENLAEVKMEFYRPQLTAATGVGQEVQFMTITLTNANIASIHYGMENNKNPELMKYAEYEDISFTYQKITITYTKGGITGQDDWRASVNLLPNNGTTTRTAAAPTSEPHARQTADRPRRISVALKN